MTKSSGTILDGESRPEGRGTGTAPRNLATLFAVAGRSAVVTGGASGIGLAIADILSDQGAHVTLLDRNPAPTRAEIAEALDGNICRCGTHHRILRAVALAAVRMSEHPRP